MAKVKKHDWSFENIGGSTRVKITTGADIANLDQLDPKMWTVLSCPSTGLEIDEKSLKYIDTDNDGRIRVNDIVSTAKWMTAALNDADLLLKGDDKISLNALNQEDATGKKLYNSAKQILANLGKEGDTISIADTADTAAIFAKTAFNGDGIITELSTADLDEKAAIAAAIASVGSVTDRSGDKGLNAELVEKFYQALADYTAWKAAEVEAPYGADTDKAIEAYNALDAKVKDYFVRARLASFAPESAAKLDVQSALIETISADNLTGKTEEIAAYPIARVTDKAELLLDASINPAWADKFKTLIAIIQPKEKAFTAESWAAIGAAFAAYSGWKGAKKGAEVEALGLEAINKFIADDKKQALLNLIAQDNTLKEEAESIEMVGKFLYIYRDFYRLLRNFVTFHDFYNKDKKVGAIFQSGRLIIDQRECRLCMKVADMGKHNTMAAASGMYLVYCDCTSPLKAAKQTIVATVTVGDIGDLFVGKNAIYYDNEGGVWDAVITKIIDNPISIGQAFWSPYRRMSTVVENLINKSAADKDAAMMKDMTAKINEAPKATPTAEGKPASSAFDIAKFAGIFAALGMALGMIGSAIAGIFDSLIKLSLLQLVGVFVGIMLIISGPAMVLAWMKLRRRNIAPLLNANGWAINAASKISIPFGETLTDIAKYPKLKLKDPYAKKGLPTWKKGLISLAALIVVVGALWLGNLLAWAKLPSPLPRFHKTEAVEVVETVEATPETVEVTDSIQ
ncbi:MAG: hypothetical protein IKV15_03645 [Bacteroidaceae bacterium]|nr:hypothetical protein [Bacteroidaceae bacterium]